ncbi:hypothetical protein H8L32_23240 [Undibacterium sp. CY18W]|uniref:Uncharacterized protein n=1 Tax=Undibacterium hunanense TaxID=2762292 RepID=A0ABR6ZX10_9BURK|nr:hypothetical protein [Undibacterium hunanense]MBC3920398.1 hypothetical protein [Undibacterium hunanense]
MYVITNEAQLNDVAGGEWGDIYLADTEKLASNDLDAFGLSCERAMSGTKDVVLTACGSAPGLTKFACAAVVSVGGDLLKDVVCAPSTPTTTTVPDIPINDFNGSCLSDSAYQKAVSDAMTKASTP